MSCRKYIPRRPSHSDNLNSTLFMCDTQDPSSHSFTSIAAISLQSPAIHLSGSITSIITLYILFALVITAFNAFLTVMGLFHSQSIGKNFAYDFEPLILLKIFDGISLNAGLTLCIQNILGPCMSNKNILKLVIYVTCSSFLSKYFRSFFNSLLVCFKKL